MEALALARPAAGLAGMFRPFMVLLPLLACGDSGPAEPAPPPAPPARVPTSIALDPPSAVLRQGESLRFTATVHDQHDRPMPRIAVTWRSSDPTTATVDTTGLVTALRDGKTTITAGAGTVTGMAVVTVDDALADRAVLAVLFEATEGSRWKNSSNWLSDAPLADWHGVEVDADGRVTKLQLGGNGLGGGIPAQIGRLSRLTELSLNDNALGGGIPWELGDLSELRSLRLWSNDLAGWIPATLGNLSELTRLSLEHNDLTGPIPRELGGLPRLDTLTLWNNELTGSIPPELGALSALRILYLGINNLKGSIPPEIGDLSRLREFYANSNKLSGPIPPEIATLSELRILGLWSNGLAGSIPSELGHLAELEYLRLDDNALTGPIPPELGQLRALERLELQRNLLDGPIPATLGRLTRLEQLSLAHNALSGPLPAELSGLVALRELYLHENPDLSGLLPVGLRDLSHLTTLHAGGTSLCSPADPDFLAWLGTLPNQRVRRCGDDTSPVYLVQAVQSLEYPVPVVADRPALLRVFLTAPDASVDFPPLLVRFYLEDAEVHAVRIPGPGGTVPSRLEEGRLDASANVAIPADVVQPGLELVVEVDPDETLAAGHGLPKRIPAEGRRAIDVRAAPPLHLTYVPLFGNDGEYLQLLPRVQNLTKDDELFRPAREWLPVADFTLVVRDFVFSQAETGDQLIRQIEVMRVLEGGTGYYMGGMGEDLARRLGLGGRGYISGRASIANQSPATVAHELGHNMSLRHAPCGGAGGPDPGFPTMDGTIGAWGFDSSDSSLVAPDTPDLMSYCRPRWIGDYGFTKAFRHRLREDGGTAAAPANGTRTLLVWGGVDAEGVPVLEPAFVVDAPPTLPRSTGPYTLTGMTAAGEELFSLRFDMQEAADGDGESGFVFALPVSETWGDRLARILLSGPEGTATLDGGGPPAALLRDPRTGRVRGILRDLTRLDPGLGTLAGAAADPVSIASVLPDAADLEILVSRGLPPADQWRR